MYYVKVPEPVQLINKTTGNVIVKSAEDDTPMEPFNMFRWLVQFVTSDPAFGKGRVADRARCKLEDKLEHAEPGDVIAIEDQHREFAMKAIDKPENPQPGAWMSQLTGFQDAIADATTEKPAIENEEEGVADAA